MVENLAAACLVFGYLALLIWVGQFQFRSARDEGDGLFGAVGAAIAGTSILWIGPVGGGLLALVSIVTGWDFFLSEPCTQYEPNSYEYERCWDDAHTPPAYR